MQGLSKTIRGIPPDTHRVLRLHAALKGVSFEKYVRDMLIEQAEALHPTKPKGEVLHGGLSEGRADGVQAG